MEMVIAVIVAATAVAPAVMGNAEHTLHCTHGAADTGADRASDHSAHGPGDAVALIGAFLGAPTMPWLWPGCGNASKASRIAATAKSRRKGKPTGNAAAVSRALFISIPMG